MENVNVEKLVKVEIEKLSIKFLNLGLGKTALKNAGIKTIGELVEIIENNKINSIKGIGEKSLRSIESKLFLCRMNFQNQIKAFDILPPNKEKWHNYLRLARVIFGVKDEFPERALNGEGIEEVLHTLTPREERVLELRFGLYDSKLWNLDEVAKEFVITRKRVKQIELKALRKLRNPLRKRKILREDIKIN